MLVRFHSKAAAGVTMFGDIAAELLRLMGMSGMVPGGARAQDVPEALRRLKQAIGSSEGDRVLVPGPSGNAKKEDGENEDNTVKISLRTRAYPLVQLLEAAAAAECAVVWEDAGTATG